MASKTLVALHLQKLQYFIVLSLEIRHFKNGKWRHILALLNSVASAADGIQKEAKNQVASVGIRTQTLTSSLDQVICP